MEPFEMPSNLQPPPLNEDMSTMKCIELLSSTFCFSLLPEHIKQCFVLILAELCALRHGEDERLPAELGLVCDSSAFQIKCMTQVYEQTCALWVMVVSETKMHSLKVVPGFESRCS